MIIMKVLSHANLQDDYAHSVLISLLRGAAALEVAAAHLRAQVYPGYSLVENPTLAFQALAFFTGFAHQAVVVFFLLSGWLVGGSLLNKRGREDAIKHYFIDRLTRLWIVLVPTFLVIIVFGILAGIVNPRDVSIQPGNEYSAAAFFGNLAGLQNLLVPTFGGNFPLWSLSNETWYYVLFPLLVVIGTSRSTWSRVSASLAVVSLFVFLSGSILLYFSIWLMGVGCSRIRLDTSAWMRWILFAAFALISAYFRVRGETDDLGPDSFVQDYIFSVAFLLFLASMQYKLPSGAGLWVKVKQIGKFFADFSFTLYVLHVPLIGMAVYMSDYLASQRLSPNNPAHLAAYFTILCAIVAGSYLFHLPFEANTHRLRNVLKRAITFRKPAVAT
jgi:peptidoglycan/LPS O-acetylase OafA/YrhL